MGLKDLLPITLKGLGLLLHTVRRDVLLLLLQVTRQFDYAQQAPSRHPMLPSRHPAGIRQTALPHLQELLHQHSRRH